MTTSQLHLLLCYSLLECKEFRVTSFSVETNLRDRSRRHLQNSSTGAKTENRKKFFDIFYVVIKRDIRDAILAG